MAVTRGGEVTAVATPRRDDGPEERKPAGSRRAGSGEAVAGNVRTGTPRLPRTGRQDARQPCCGAARNRSLQRSRSRMDRDPRARCGLGFAACGQASTSQCGVRPSGYDTRSNGGKGEFTERLCRLDGGGTAAGHGVRARCVGVGDTLAVADRAELTRAIVTMHGLALLAAPSAAIRAGVWQKSPRRPAVTARHHRSSAGRLRPCWSLRQQRGGRRASHLHRRARRLHEALVAAARPGVYRSTGRRAAKGLRRRAWGHRPRQVAPIEPRAGPADGGKTQCARRRASSVRGSIANRYRRDRPAEKRTTGAPAAFRPGGLSQSCRDGKMCIT